MDQGTSFTSGQVCEFIDSCKIKLLNSSLLPTKCDMVEDGFTEHASEGKPKGEDKEANPMILCNPGNVRRNG
jgi:hypothetical protein